MLAGIPRSPWPRAWSRERRSTATMASAVVLMLVVLWGLARLVAFAPEPIGSNAQAFADGAKMTVEILQRLKFPRRETERVALLVAEHNWHYLPEWNDATVRRILARIGPGELPALWALRRADLNARGRLVQEGLVTQQAAEERFAREVERSAALKITDLAIGGEDVMRGLKIRPGREVGQVLAQLLERVIDDPDLNTRETLLRLVAEVARKLSTGNSQG